MTLNIQEVLNRRNDLSTFVVHLTREREGVSAKEALESIIQSKQLLAGRAMGWASNQDDPSDVTRQTQRVVCFSETPLEHIYSMTADIWGRSVALAPYGLALTKMDARSRGINPVWYVDMTPGQTAHWEIAHAIDGMRDAAIASGSFHTQPFAKIAPFVEQMGTWTDSQKEFWWEREWRHRGTMTFSLASVALWLCRENEIDHFEDLIGSQDPSGNLKPKCIDPNWGLEQIVAHLIGTVKVTPFDAR